MVQNVDNTVGMLFKKLMQGELTNDALLENELQIETAILMIAQLQEKIDWLKRLKEYRVKSIDESIQKFEDQENIIRSVIKNTMVTYVPNKKVLDFPGIGKVTRKINKPNWKIEDDEAVLRFLLEEGRVEAIKTEQKIVKKELNAICDEFESKNKQVPGVSKTEATESLAVTIDSNCKISEKTSSFSMDDIDSLDQV